MAPIQGPPGDTHEPEVEARGAPRDGARGARKPIPVLVRALIVTEVISLLAGFIFAVVARQSGGSFSLAGNIVEDPSFFVEFVISFAVVNVLLSGFALAYVMVSGQQRRR